MLVEMFGNLSKYETIDISSTYLPDIISILKCNFGDEFYKELANNYYYVVFNKNSEIPDFLALYPDIVTSDLSAYDSLYIIPQLSDGEVPAPLVAAAFGVAAASLSTLSLSTAAIYLLTAAINIGLSMGISLLMNSIAPTATFAGDPAFMQNRLFNGAPPTTEIGGSVPIVVGNPFCSGVLISSGITTGNF